MYEHFPLLAAHAATAAFLALIVALICRRVRHAAVVHVLWVVVLLKLITPPIFEWSVLPTLTEKTSVASTAAMQEVAVSKTLSPTLATPPVSPVPEPPGLEVSPVQAGLVVWILGSLFVLGWTGRNLRRFSTLLAAATPASPALVWQVERLSAQLGLRRTPSVRLLPVRLSPMVWPRPGGGEILLPEALLPRLEESELDAVLVHELAHLKRRDHWVRLLEMATTVLFWWHPALWWARGRLRQAEERSCDAWVVHALPGKARAYAEGLLKTLEHLTEGDRPVPLPATGMEPHEMKERLTMILTQKTPQLLRPWHRALLGLTAATVLVVLPTWAQPQDENARTDERKQYEERMIDLERQELALEEQMRELEIQRRALEVERVDAETAAHHQELEQQINDLEKDGRQMEADQLRKEMELMEHRAEVHRRELELERERAEELIPLEREMHEKALLARELALQGDHEEARRLEQEMRGQKRKIAEEHVRMQKEHMALEREHMQRRQAAVASRIAALREAGRMDEAQRLEGESRHMEAERLAAALRERQMEAEMKVRLETERMRAKAEEMTAAGKRDEAEALRAKAEALRTEARAQQKKAHRELRKIQREQEIQALKMRARQLREVREEVDGETLEEIEKELVEIQEELGEAGKDES